MQIRPFIAFVPLVGVTVIPLQIVVLLLRGVLFEYIALTALGAYVTLYRRHPLTTERGVDPAAVGRDRGAVNAWG